MRQSRDEQLQDLLLLPAGLEDQKMEVVGAGGAPRKSCHHGGGCLKEPWPQRDLLSRRR